MRFFINGAEGNSLIHVRNADSTFNVLFLTDTGQPLSLASPAEAVVEFFTAKARVDAPPTSITVTPSAGAAAGLGTIVVQDTNLDLSRTKWYVWGRYKSNAGTGPGTLVYIGGTPSTLEVI
jgi:hypothetical protein